MSYPQPKVLDMSHARAIVHVVDMPMQSKGGTVGQTEPVPFATWLGKHARGTLNDEATAAMASLVQAVSDRGKAGTLTLTITVTPTGSTGRMVAAGGKVTTKAPEPAPEVGVFYVGEGGTLHRDDPYQLSMLSRDEEVVNTETGEITRLAQQNTGVVPHEIADAPEAVTE